MAYTGAELQRRYRLRHPERVRENRKARYENEKLWARERRASLTTWPKAVLPNIKFRAKDQGVEFDLVATDLVVPSHCPVLGIALKAGSKTHVDCSPSVDRIDPKGGYVRGNVAVISYRANRLKCDATIEELEKVIEYLRNLGCEL